MTLAILVIAVIFIVFIMGPRPRLDPTLRRQDVPEDLPLPELAEWLANKESQVDGLAEGAGACIQFANPENPERTPLCFVYIHGFSATWPETAPVTQRLASQFGANVLQARLVGHGTGSVAMTTPTEAWLDAMMESWQIARELGDQVVIVATSTGAPLSIWLAHQPGIKANLYALLFMSPNFRIRSKFDFLITAPWSRKWLHWFIGKEREWEPISDQQAKFWTYRYSTLALIEMQKAVDWVNQQDLKTYTTPLAVMYMPNDPTIDPNAAVEAFRRWGARTKSLIPVLVDGDKPDHVFAGDICGPHRTDWVVKEFARFLKQLPPARGASARR